MRRMKEKGMVVIKFLEDRGFEKVRVNMIKDDKIWGFIKPV